ALVLLGFCGIALAPVPARAAAAGGCHTLLDGASHYVVCSFDMRQNRNPEEMRLFFAGPHSKPLGGFAALAAILKQRGEILLFGMNAGMYQEDLRPVGLFIQAHKQIHPVNLRGGSGNFHLKPNGIFYFGDHSAGVMETSAFVKSGLKPEYATQSGPMLVLDGKIHPKIQPDGTSEKIRNGVGVRDGHIVVFAISEDPVTFYRFASLFRDQLACPNALYLDGSVSSLYAPSLGRADGLRPLGPMVGIVEKVQDISHEQH
ncbi:MAG TPA: phosphodiester glycosidase family protein, partial [Methylovirgula sp.]